MSRPQQDPDNPWLCKPSLVVAIIVSHLYIVTTGVRLFQAITYRARVCIPIIIGGAWEALGYILRAIGTRHENSVGLYATQFTLIVLATACKPQVLSQNQIVYPAHSLFEVVVTFNYMLFRQL
jgi:hypothetical protein